MNIVINYLDSEKYEYQNITCTIPENMIGWTSGPAMDFGASGLYSYDGSTWTLITDSDVEDMDDVDLF